jgi:hypothetical protein
MNESESKSATSRRLFLQAGAAALAGAAVACNSQPTPKAAKAPPSETAGATQSGSAKTAKAITGTAPNTALSKEYVQMIGRFAYFWGWPMVNSFNRRTAMASVPEPGLRGGILPNAPLGQVCMLTEYISSEQRFVTCSNQDVAYGFGFGALDDSPVIMQVPDFGDRFWVFAAWDARTDSFAELGKQYGTKPGFYLLVGPNWKWEGARWHQRNVSILHGARGLVSARLPGRHRGRPEGNPTRPKSDRGVSAKPV